MTILIVDDERIVRNFLKRFFDFKGIKSRIAEDAFTAFKIAKTEEFDIIFLDIRMPSIDGFEAMRELKRINPKSAFVMISGYAIDKDEARMNEEGIVAFLKKPFDIRQLEEVIEGFGKPR